MHPEECDVCDIYAYNIFELNQNFASPCKERQFANNRQNPARAGPEVVKSIENETPQHMVPLINSFHFTNSSLLISKMKEFRSARQHKEQTLLCYLQVEEVRVLVTHIHTVHLKVA